MVTLELILMQTQFVWRQFRSALHWKPTFSATSAQSKKKKAIQITPMDPGMRKLSLSFDSAEMLCLLCVFGFS